VDQGNAILTIGKSDGLAEALLLFLS